MEDAVGGGEDEEGVLFGGEGGGSGQLGVRLMGRGPIKGGGFMGERKRETYGFIPFTQVIDILIGNGDKRVSADEVYDSGDTLEESLFPSC